ncbi:MAG: hypothetical protein BMS9Abin36_1487 [Gammaproteobacteria bacterium]|nr:MAG: hypothetical protein BMS9Abin36_1487 [Gammaproteobacteria bacterium]
MLLIDFEDRLAPRFMTQYQAPSYSMRSSRAIYHTQHNYYLYTRFDNPLASLLAASC